MQLKILIHRMIPKAPTDKFMCLQISLFNLLSTELERDKIIKYSIYHQSVPVLNQVLTGDFFLVFLCTVECQQFNLVFFLSDILVSNPYMVLIISSFSAVLNVLCLVMLAAAFLLILRVLWEPLQQLSGLSEIQITKCENTVSVCNCKISTPELLE